MDPDVVLRHIRELAGKLLEMDEVVDQQTYNEMVMDFISAALSLAGGFQVLDDWLTKGGFLPADWRARA